VPASHVTPPMGHDVAMQRTRPFDSFAGGVP
jgi:hypothetical protein